MAYQNASATDVADLLDKLRLFLIGAGWTVDNWALIGAGPARQLSVHLGSFYATFITQVTGGNTADPVPYIGVIGHTGYTAGGYLAQVQASPAVYANALPGPFVGYDFFEGVGVDGPYVHVTVETLAGHFKHFGSGTLQKEGAYTSGQYTFASGWAYVTAPSRIDAPDDGQHRIPFDGRELVWGYVRADADGASPQWLEGRLGQSTNSRCVAAGFSRAASANPDSTGTIGGPSRSSPSNLTGRAQLWPLWCMAERPSNFYSPLGYPADMRYIKLDNYNPKDVLTLGTDQWKVFPAMRKNGLAGEPNSGVYGYAYRINS